MRDPSEATAATEFPTERRSLASRLVQPAPGPETPDVRDRGGAQRGMLILLVGGAGFWAAVAALVVYLMR